MIGALIIGVILLVLLAKAIGNPYYGLLGLLVINTVNPGELYDIYNTLHVERVFVLIVLVATLAKIKLRFPAITKSLFVFWMLMLVGVLFAFFKGGALEKTLSFGTIFFYHVLTVNLVDTRERMFGYLRTFMYLMLWVAGSTVWSFKQGNFNEAALRNGFERAQGLTSSVGDPNTVGITIVSGLPLVALILFFGKKMDRIAALATVVLSAVTVVLTGSRTSFLLLALLLVAFGLTRKRAVFAMPALIVIALIGWAFVPDSLKERYVSVTDVASHKEVDQSYENRLIAWSAGRAMFMDYPLFGVGTGQFVNANGSTYWPGTPKLWLNPHNLYVQLMAEHGVTGIVSWSVFILLMIGATRRVKEKLAETSEPGWMRHLPAAVQFSLFVLFVAGYSSHSLYRPTWYMLAALVAAADFVVQQQQKQPTAEPDAAAQAVTA